MSTRNRKGWYIGIVVICVVLADVPSVVAANISEFVRLSPYVEVESSYNDNVFELSEDAPLPEDANEREDLSLDAKAGVGVDITLERPYLDLGVGLDYNFQYVKYMDNTDLDNIQNNLDFNFDFSSKYEEGIVRDRMRVSLKDKLSLIPIDEEEPFYPGNLTIRNDFNAGIDYKLISTRRMAFTLGYSYGRIDYEEEDPIEVATVPDIYEESSDLTQESQTHTGKADFNYILNPKLSCLVTYTYAYTDREENPGQLVSANFSRQNVLGGFEAKLTPRIHSNIQAGYGWTSYEDVGDLSQNDQNDFLAETSITANFAHLPLVTLGYRRYFVENDFGDTLLTDNVFGRVGFKVAQGFLVNLDGDYILEDRDLFNDETVQTKLGVNSEYEILKNIKLLAGYDYKKKDFFAQNFLAVEERQETSHIFSGGVHYQVGRHFLLKGMYSYTDKTSDVADQEFSRNKFTASGKVIF